MQRKNYWLFYEIDLENLLFTVELCNKVGKSIYQLIFSRNGVKKVCSDIRFYYYLSQNNKYKVCIHEQKMDFYEQVCIHKIFPYIPQFTTLNEFYNWFHKTNARFHYKKYANIESVAKQIRKLSYYNADGKWRDIEQNGEIYLYCKWRDTQKKVHIVIANDDIFVSDIEYWQICEQESYLNLENIEEIQGFLNAYPQITLHTYVKAGGKKLFSFLMAKKMNPVMERLGKAGLAKLADNLEYYQDLNYAGKNLSDIFGVPMLVLKSTNAGEDTMLYTKEDRELLVWAFEESRSIFSKRMTLIVELWIRYYYLNRQTVFGLKDEWKGGKLSHTIAYLRDCCKKGENPYNIFCFYQNYLILSQKSGSYLHGLYPDDLHYALEETVKLLDTLDEIEKTKKFTEIVEQEEYKSLKEDLGYSKYRITIPKTPKQLREIVKELHIYWDRYLLKVTKKEIKIVFIEDKQQENLPIGLLKISEKSIIDAIGRKNKTLNEEVMEYVAHYAIRKNLEM